MSCKQDECCETKSNCCEEQSSCSSKSECNMSEMMMDLANEAWAELMKEKMKKHYEKVTGQKMDKVAMVAVEGCMGYWQSKMQGKMKCAEFSEKLNQAFMG